MAALAEAPPVTLPAARLELRLASSPPAGDVLTLWQMAAAPGAPLAPTGAGVTWSVDLPARPLDAQRLLRNQRKIIDGAAQGLPALQQRLDGFVRSGGQPLGGAQPAYALAELAGLPAPESALRDFWLAAQNESGTAAFGVLDVWKDLQQAVQDAAGLFNLLRQFGSADLVVTRQGGFLLGCTTLAWGGDLETYWVLGISPQQAALHRSHLQASLDGRMLLTRLGLLTATTTVRLAAGLAISANPFLAAGAVLNFIRQVLAEYQAFKRAH